MEDSHSPVLGLNATEVDSELAGPGGLGKSWEGGGRRWGGSQGGGSASGLRG